MFILIVLILVVILLYVAYLNRNSNGKFPPGPMWLPFIGTMHLMGQQPHIAMTKLGEKYGPIMQLWMGSNRMIVVKGTKLIREAMNDSRLLNKPTNMDVLSLLNGDEYGILQANGDVWIENRRFTLRKLRDFGFGKKTSEELIIDECVEFCHRLKKDEGKPVQLQQRLSLAVVNSLWRIMTGDRFSHDDVKLQNIIKDMEATLQEVTALQSLSGLILFLFPKIAKKFRNWSGWNRLVKSVEQRRSMYEKIITDHIDTLHLDEPRDFIDSYLMESKSVTDLKSPMHSKNAYHSLTMVVEDLFGAGTFTTSATLGWAGLYLLYNPNVQAKLHEEIDDVIGNSRLPTLEDRKKMPYTEAFIQETLRMSSLVSGGSIRCASEDMQFHGYNIPKGTYVVGNFYENHYNEEIWGDPQVFRPERFLSRDGKTLIRKDGLIAFSYGRRSCLGETLARDTLFLFIVTMLQTFIIKKYGDQFPSLQPAPSIVLAPQPYEIICKLRK